MLSVMALTDEPDELLDLVDQQDQVVGTVTREEVQEQLLALPGFVRASSCFIVNSLGQIFVPRRAPHKKVAPNGFDFSVGEHVKSGETYEQAIVRGFREELGMIINFNELRRIGIVNLRSLQMLPYFESLFVYHNNATPDYNKGDFVSHEWLDPAEFLQRLKAGEPAKKNILPALELFLQAKE